jgi:hypothetical protein
LTSAGGSCGPVLGGSRAGPRRGGGLAGEACDPDLRACRVPTALDGAGAHPPRRAAAAAGECQPPTSPDRSRCATRLHHKSPSFLPCWKQATLEEPEQATAGNLTLPVGCKDCFLCNKFWGCLQRWACCELGSLPACPGTRPARMRHLQTCCVCTTGRTCASCRLAAHTCALVELALHGLSTEACMQVR